MNWDSVDRVARALLYEGYLLYPYRTTSIKNAQRWAFGSLYPKSWSASENERSRASAEVLLVGEAPTVGVLAVFLAWCERTAEGEAPRLEAVERRVELDRMRVEELAAGRSVLFAFPAETWSEGGARYATRALKGTLEARGDRLGSTTKLSVALANTTPGEVWSSDEAKLRSFASAHLLFAVEQGRFVSGFDPPAELAAMTKTCRNDGVWPVLVGDPARSDRMLASPIIVYDYPAVASESRGDWFDATEIDEMLALRVRTLSDAEKREIRAGDPLGVEILARSEAFGAPDLAELHGARRDLEPLPGERVRLRPHGGRDAFDLMLRGELATVLSVEEDFDGRRYVTVAIDADPGRDLGSSGQPGHRFFFEPDELERLP